MTWALSDARVTPWVTSRKEAAVSSARALPFSTTERALAISSAVSLDAAAVLPAKLRTSSATTAKPFPALPARAASTAAFRARILVWKAISSIFLTICPISLEVEVISSIAVSMRSILRPPS